MVKFDNFYACISQTNSKRVLNLTEMNRRNNFNQASHLPLPHILIVIWFQLQINILNKLRWSQRSQSRLKRFETFLRRLRSTELSTSSMLDNQGLGSLSGYWSSFPWSSLELIGETINVFFSLYVTHKAQIVLFWYIILSSRARASSAKIGG